MKGLPRRAGSQTWLDFVQLSNDCHLTSALALKQHVIHIRAKRPSRSLTPAVIIVFYFFIDEGYTNLPGWDRKHPWFVELEGLAVVGFEFRKSISALHDVNDFTAVESDY